MANDPDEPRAEPLPAHNDHPQLHAEGALAALRPALNKLHVDVAQAHQLEFQQGVMIQAVLQVLMSKGFVTKAELDHAFPMIHQMMLEVRELQYAGPIMAGTAVPDAPADLDCKAHHPTCGAACCTSFGVYLTPEEARSNKYLWDLAEPYRLLADADGACVYFDRDRLACTIWNDRPKACRAFDCRTDGRVWSDYPQRRLSTELMERRAALAAARARAAKPVDW